MSTFETRRTAARSYLFDGVENETSIPEAAVGLHKRPARKRCERARLIKQGEYVRVGHNFLQIVRTEEEKTVAQFFGVRVVADSIVVRGGGGGGVAARVRRPDVRLLVLGLLLRSRKGRRLLRRRRCRRCAQSLGGFFVEGYDGSEVEGGVSGQQVGILLVG